MQVLEITTTTIIATCLPLTLTNILFFLGFFDYLLYFSNEMHMTQTCVVELRLFAKCCV